eukprot:756013-Hanusia_phi.AAC.10
MTTEEGGDAKAPAGRVRQAGRGGDKETEGEVGDQLEVQEADLDYRLPDGEVRELEAGNSFAAVHLQRHRGQKALVRIRRVRPEGFLLAAVEVSKLRGEGEEDEAGGGRQLRVGMGYAERWAGDRNHVDGNQLSVPDGVCQARVSDGDLQVSEPVLERRQAELEAAVGSVEEGGKGEERLISAHQLDVANLYAQPVAVSWQRLHPAPGVGAREIRDEAARGQLDQSPGAEDRGEQTEVVLVVGDKLVGSERRVIQGGDEH